MLGLLLWKEGGLIDFGLFEMTSVVRNLNIYANLFTLSEIEEKPRFLFLFSFPVKVFQPIEVLIRCHLSVISQSLTKQVMLSLGKTGDGPQVKKRNAKLQLNF